MCRPVAAAVLLAATLAAAQPTASVTEQLRFPLEVRAHTADEFATVEVTASGNTGPRLVRRSAALTGEAAALSDGATGEDGAPLKCHVMYWNADHNLDTAISSDLEELITNTAAVSHPNYYPIVYLDRHANASKRIEGLKAMNGVDDAPIYSGARCIEKDFKTGSMKVAQEFGEQNSDSQDTMTNFLTVAFGRCKAKSPNARILLSMGSHGGGWLGFGGDELSDSLLEGGRVGRSHLGMIRNTQIRAAIRDAMSKVVPPIMGKLDLLAFDACNMMTFSALYALDDVAELYMGSEATEPGHGWDYSAVDPSLSSLGMAQKIIDAFAYGSHRGPPVTEDGGNHQSPKTLAVFRTEDFAPFRATMDALATDMERTLKAEEPGGLAAKLIGMARRATISADEPAMEWVDLGDLIKNLKRWTWEAVPPLRYAIAAAEAKYAQMLLHGHVAVGPWTNNAATGMAIWFPRNAEELDTDEVRQWRTGKEGFKAAENRPWQKFLDALYLPNDAKEEEEESGGGFPDDYPRGNGTDKELNGGGFPDDNPRGSGTDKELNGIPQKH